MISNAEKEKVIEEGRQSLAESFGFTRIPTIYLKEDEVLVVAAGNWTFSCNGYSGDIKDRVVSKNGFVYPAIRSSGFIENAFQVRLDFQNRPNDYTSDTCLFKKVDVNVGETAVRIKKAGDYKSNSFKIGRVEGICALMDRTIYKDQIRVGNEYYPFNENEYEPIAKIERKVTFANHLPSGSWLTTEQNIDWGKPSIATQNPCKEYPRRVIKIGNKNNSATEEDIADMQEQLKKIAHDPNIHIVTRYQDMSSFKNHFTFGNLTLKNDNFSELEKEVKEISAKRVKISQCSECNGKGKIMLFTSISECSKCKGFGYI